MQLSSLPCIWPRFSYRVTRDDDVSVSAILEAMNSSAVFEEVAIHLIAGLINVDVTKKHSRIHVTKEPSV